MGKRGDRRRARQDRLWGKRLAYLMTRTRPPHPSAFQFPKYAGEPELIDVGGWSYSMQYINARETSLVFASMKLHEAIQVIERLGVDRVSATIDAIDETVARIAGTEYPDGTVPQDELDELRQAP